MEIDFGKIIQLKGIYIEKQEIMAQEKELSAPILTDKGLIQEIYSLFIDFIARREDPSTVHSAYNRKKFIFVILYLYSPKTLSGQKMDSCLRKEIAKALPQRKNQCFISVDVPNAIFLYQNYGDFKSDVDDFFLYMQQGITL